MAFSMRRAPKYYSHLTEAELIGEFQSAKQDLANCIRDMNSVTRKPKLQGFLMHEMYMLESHIECLKCALVCRHDERAKAQNKKN